MGSHSHFWAEPLMARCFLPPFPACSEGQGLCPSSLSAQQSHRTLHRELGGQQGSARLVHLEWGSPAPRHICLRSWVNSPWPPTPDYIYDLLFAGFFLRISSDTDCWVLHVPLRGWSLHPAHIPVTQHEAGAYW